MQEKDKISTRCYHIAEKTFFKNYFFNTLENWIINQNLFQVTLHATMVIKCKDLNFI